MDHERIQQKTRDAIDDIADAFIDANRQPSDEVIDVLIDILGTSPNSARRLFANRAKKRGLLFMNGYLKEEDPA